MTDAQSSRQAAAQPVRDLAVATPESVGVSSERLERLDAAMKKVVDDSSSPASSRCSPGTARWSTSTRRSEGHAQARPDEKDSIFRIYSMTKPVTGVAMMMLYEEGKWRLDDPVSRYIPEFAKLKVYMGENADGTPKLEDARRSMTMRELMTHYGGPGLHLEPATTRSTK